MNTCMNIDQYCKAVKKALRCSPKGKKIILKSIRSGMEEYLEAHPEATVADLYDEFGSPEAYAAEYVASLDDQVLVQTVTKNTRRNRIILIAAISVVSIVAIVSVALAIYIANYNEDAGGPYYYEESIEEGTTTPLD